MDDYFSFETVCPLRIVYTGCILKKQIMQFTEGSYIPKIIVEDDFYVILFDSFGNPFGTYL
jgi:hypothetical protein